MLTKCSIDRIRARYNVEFLAREALEVRSAVNWSFWFSFQARSSTDKSIIKEKKER